MKKLLGNQKGQAIFELVLFLPFLIFLYSIFYTVGNSVSGSINQQKAVRGYFYHLTKNNSYINTHRDILYFADQASLKVIGFGAVGWREKEGGNDNAFAPCFTFASMLRGSSEEKCEDPTRPVAESSSFIRIFTFYGVCGPVYSAPASGVGNYKIEPTMQSNPALCSLSASSP